MEENTDYSCRVSKREKGNGIENNNLCFLNWKEKLCCEVIHKTLLLMEKKGYNVNTKGAADIFYWMFNDLEHWNFGDETIPDEQKIVIAKGGK